MINALTSIDALASHPSCADHSRRIATDQLIGLNTEVDIFQSYLNLSP